MPSMSREKMIDSRYRPRTNLALDPRATSLTYWKTGVGGGGASASLLTGQAPPFPGGPTTAMQGTVTTAGTYLDVRTSDVAGSRITVRAGVAYSLSAWAKFSTAGAAIDVFVQYADAAGAVLSTASQAFPANVANTWAQYTLLNKVAPANAVFAWLIVRRSGGGGVAIGATGTGTAAVVEEGPVLHAYFDGSMRNAGWAGTANASPSHTNGWVGLT